MIIAKILRRLGVAYRVNRTVVIRENGSSFRVPLLGLHGYANLNLSEPWMTELLKKTKCLYDSHGGSFVDVGTNVGQTLLKIRSVDFTMPYVGFEPNPTCVHYMNELIRANNFVNTSIYPFGISDKAEVLELQFYVDNDEDSSASLIESFRPDQKVHRRLFVPVFPPTSVNWFSRIAFLKVDVEGGELEVIRGFREKLNLDRPLVLTEILPCYETTNHTRIQRQHEVELVFKDLKYTCHRVIRDANGNFGHLEKIDQIGVHAKIEWSDYLWVPEERLNALLDAVSVSRQNA
jgi:FkbM family methyltransferase